MPKFGTLMMLMLLFSFIKVHLHFNHCHWQRFRFPQSQLQFFVKFALYDIFASRILMRIALHAPPHAGFYILIITLADTSRAQPESHFVAGDL
jgi:hypothetical protein